MFVTSHTLRSIAWAALAVSAARAQYVIDNLSFGQKEGQPISPDPRGLPHFSIQGEGHTPQILSDRVILTPPYPGQTRGALWSEDALHHAGDWTAELHFRASGMERGGGNLQLWYTKETQKNEPPSSLYTAPKFDGLVLVVDQYEGHGGSVRGFLNDGTMDIKAHTAPDTLAFGMCNYPYRNLGRFSVLKLHLANGIFEVTIDDKPCFFTDKIRLPEGYHFGISAASAENPDSFEVQKFVVSTTNAYTREEPNMQQKQQYMGQRQQQQQQAHQDSRQHQQHQQQQKPNEPAVGDIPQMLSDVLAGSLKSQEDQFADLHNRIQIINHRVNEISDLLHRIVGDNDQRFNEIMHRLVPVDDRTNMMIRTVEKIDRTSSEVQRDLESKDFKDLLNTVHNAISDSHNALNAQMPLAMAHIVGKDRPSMTTYLFIAVAVQVMVVGAYMVYKSRRKGAPKKYL